MDRIAEFFKRTEPHSPLAYRWRKRCAEDGCRWPNCWPKSFRTGCARVDVGAAWHETAGVGPALVGQRYPDVRGRGSFAFPYRPGQRRSDDPQACQTRPPCLSEPPIVPPGLRESTNPEGDRAERRVAPVRRILVGGVRGAAEACDSQLEQIHGQIRRPALELQARTVQATSRNWPGARQRLIEPSRRCIRRRPAISGVGIAPQWNGAPATNQEAEQFSRGNGAATGKATQRRRWSSGLPPATFEPDRSHAGAGSQRRLGSKSFTSPSSRDVGVIQMASIIGIPGNPA